MVKNPADCFTFSCLASWTSQRTKELGLTFRILMHGKYFNASRNVKNYSKIKNVSHRENFKFHFSVTTFAKFKIFFFPWKMVIFFMHIFPENLVVNWNVILLMKSLFFQSSVGIMQNSFCNEQLSYFEEIYVCLI